MSEITLNILVEASSPGGGNCLTSVTELEPAAGPHASVAPAKYASPIPNDRNGAYAYERRYLGGVSQPAVLVDSKQSQLNRVEAALQLAIEQGHPTLSRLPRIEVRYERDGVTETYSDLTLPHRGFDGHIRAGTSGGEPVTRTDEYRAIRNATAGNARGLLDASPASLIFGSWDSTRATRQGRWRSALVGEIIGFCEEGDRAEARRGGAREARRGGARVDPVGMQIRLTPSELTALAEAQSADLSAATMKKVMTAANKAKSGEQLSASMLVLGGIPPTLDALSGVACHRIIRSHVLSFATLRQIRFGGDVKADVACRALLAALALNGLARSDAELYLRANCDLREKSVSVVEIDRRGGSRVPLSALSVAAADALLDAALQHAERAASVRWNGVVLEVDGNPAIVAGAVAEDAEETVS